MSHRDIVVVGASAGGIEPLVRILQALPASLSAAIFVVVHTSPDSAGVLPEILSRRSHWKGHNARQGQAIEYGHIYVAPPDHHMMLTQTGIAVMRGPRQNGFRPAIDPMFRSAADFYGPRVIGVILSGALDDGTFGLMAIKDRGGLALVQHPEDALVPSMPMSAIQNVAIDEIVRSDDMAGVLAQSIGVSSPNLSWRPPIMNPQNSPSHDNGNGDGEDREQHMGAVNPDDMQKPPSVFTCPDCGGSLWEFDEGGLPRFRCHTGHGFTADGLLLHQNGKLEVALWSAVRVLQERSALHRQMADRCRSRSMNSAAGRYEEQADEEESRSNVLRSFLTGEHSVSRDARAS